MKLYSPAIVLAVWAVAVFATGAALVALGAISLALATTAHVHEQLSRRDG